MTTQQTDPGYESLRTQVQYEVTIEASWLDFCRGSDLFRRSYCGYWLLGFSYDGDDWLCYEVEERSISGDLPNQEEAQKAWQSGQPLPANWFVLGHDVAVRAYVIGCQLRGKGWYSGEHSDANGYDRLIQQALLGTEKYG